MVRKENDDGMERKLLTPKFRVNLKDYILTDGIEVSCFGSRETKCDWCKVELTSQLQKLITYEDFEAASVQLGYEENYDTLITGHARRTGNDYWKEILIRDDMIKLERIELRETFQYCEPQDIIKYILLRAGIDKFVLSGASYGSKDVVMLNNENGINSIKEINSAWGIANDFFFRDGVFYWGCRPEQDAIYILRENENILSMQKYGELFEIETLGVPWIHHSQRIKVEHSKYSGLPLVEKTIIKSDEEGRVRMYIYFKGGEENV